MIKLMVSFVIVVFLILLAYIMFGSWDEKYEQQTQVPAENGYDYNPIGNDCSDCKG